MGLVGTGKCREQATTCQCVFRHRIKSQAGRELESRAKRVIWGDDAPDSPACPQRRPGLPSCQTVAEEAQVEGEFTNECERV